MSELVVAVVALVLCAIFLSAALALIIFDNTSAAIILAITGLIFIMLVSAVLPEPENKNGTPYTPDCACRCECCEKG